MKKVMRKNKGFTLVETLVVMAIVSIISSIIFLEMKSYNSFKNDMDASYFNDDIVSFINEARHYCIEKECHGEISFYVNATTMKFYEGSVLKDESALPLGFIITSNDVTTSDNQIYIENTGVITTPCSLQYRDRKGIVHLITIGVGTANVEIQN
jgi:prepilin-type N-terminal cleavage/methylation domain-containing protein